MKTKTLFFCLFVIVILFCVGLTIGEWNTRKVKVYDEGPATLEATETQFMECTAKAVEEPIAERTYFDVPLSQEVQDCIFDECEKAGISPALIVAIIERESDFDIENVGDNGQSIGLMQIQPKWHMQRMIDLNCEDLLDPCQNIKVGINYLSEQINRYDGDVAKAVVAYNQGHFNGKFTEYSVNVLERAVALGVEA